MQERRAFYVIFAIAAALIVPAALTLRTVVHPVVLQPTSDNPTPLGYTWSLLLFIIPIGALGCWFACQPDLQFPRKAFWRTIAVLTPLGFLLDLLFGKTKNALPNRRSSRKPSGVSTASVRQNAFWETANRVDRKTTSRARRLG